MYEVEKDWREKLAERQRKFQLLLDAVTNPDKARKKRAAKKKLALWERVNAKRRSSPKKQQPRHPPPSKPELTVIRKRPWP